MAVNHIEEFIAFETLRQSMLGGLMPKGFRLAGHLYHQGSSSAESLSTMIVDGKHNNMFISWACFDDDVPYGQRYVVATYRVAGVNIVLHQIALAPCTP